METKVLVVILVSCSFCSFLSAFGNWIWIWNGVVLWVPAQTPNERRDDPSNDGGILGRREGRRGASVSRRDPTLHIFWGHPLRRGGVPSLLFYNELKDGDVVELRSWWVLSFGWFDMTVNYTKNLVPSNWQWMKVELLSSQHGWQLGPINGLIRSNPHKQPWRESLKCQSKSVTWEKDAFLPQSRWLWWAETNRFVLTTKFNSAG